jgi:predicted Rossmann fold flavoprotein
VTSESVDVAVIGGGPAGLFCAALLPPSRRVVVLERMPSPGKKLLLSGSGQANITHTGDLQSFLQRYGENGSFLRHAFRNLSNDELIRWFDGAGVPTEVREDGKVFPASHRARDVLDALLAAISKNGVGLVDGARVESVERVTGGFQVRSGTGIVVQARTVVLATGGMSYPATGSSGDGYRLAASLGHTIVEPRPALAPLEPEPYPFASLAGIAVQDAGLSLFRDGRRVGDERGPLLFTHTGLSGPVVLDLSRNVRPADALAVSFLPTVPFEALDRRIVQLCSERGPAHLHSALAPLGLPDRLLRSLITVAGIPGETVAARLSREQRRQLVRVLGELPFRIKSVGGFTTAMATAGGVALEEVDPKTMESRLVPGLFLAGELLDIDGDSGGYNLQAAFSTGALAATVIARRFG